VSVFPKSPARLGLDWLLEANPHLELLMVEWQHDGPWLLVTLGQQSAIGDNVFARHPYAIFKRTGAVHGMDRGAVIDPPLFVPEAVTS
jgi:hypothetical protein